MNEFNLSFSYIEPPTDPFDIIKENEHLKNEINKLADWLLDKAPELIEEGSACDNAVRLLNFYVLEEDIPTLIEREMEKDIGVEDSQDAENDLDQLGRTIDYVMSLRSNAEPHE